jgi:hypothetical protein
MYTSRWVRTLNTNHASSSSSSCLVSSSRFVAIIHCLPDLRTSARTLPISFLFYFASCSSFIFYSTVGHSTRTVSLLLQATPCLPTNCVAARRASSRCPHDRRPSRAPLTVSSTLAACEKFFMHLPIPCSITLIRASLHARRAC